MMKVHGVEIEQATIDAAINAFPAERSFTLVDLRGQLVRLGVPLNASDRCADRALQKCRKAGTHSFSGGKWRRREVTP